MRISSIDIGTNTILLLVADVEAGAIKNVLHDEQVIARLGKGVDEHRIIGEETIRRVIQFLLSYRVTSHRLKAGRLIAVGTSALRDASNKREFCDLVRQETGIDVEILSGDEEAEWTYRGAILDLDGEADDVTVLDIGGGSTEFIRGDLG